MNRRSFVTTVCGIFSGLICFTRDIGRRAMGRTAEITTPTLADKIRQAELDFFNETPLPKFVKIIRVPKPEGYFLKFDNEAVAAYRNGNQWFDGASDGMTFRRFITSRYAYPLAPEASVNSESQKPNAASEVRNAVAIRALLFQEESMVVYGGKNNSSTALLGTGLWTDGHAEDTVEAVWERISATMGDLVSRDELVCVISEDDAEKIIASGHSLPKCAVVVKNSRLDGSAYFLILSKEAHEGSRKVDFSTIQMYLYEDMTVEKIGESHFRMVDDYAIEAAAPASGFIVTDITRTTK